MGARGRTDLGGRWCRALTREVLEDPVWGVLGGGKAESVLDILAVGDFGVHWEGEPAGGGAQRSVRLGTAARAGKAPSRPPEELK